MFCQRFFICVIIDVYNYHEKKHYHHLSLSFFLHIYFVLLKIIVKVSDKKCQKYYENDNGRRVYDDNGNGVQYPDLGNKDDCFTSVNWT